MLQRLAQNWEAKLKRDGYKEDRWGNFKKLKGTRLYRWKTGKRVVRLEIKGLYSGNWLRLASYLYPKNGGDRK